MEQFTFDFVAKLNENAYLTILDGDNWWIYG